MFCFQWGVPFFVADRMYQQSFVDSILIFIFNGIHQHSFLQGGYTNNILSIQISNLFQ